MRNNAAYNKILLISAAVCLAVIILSAVITASAGVTVLAPAGYWDFDKPLSLQVNDDGIYVLDDPAMLVSFSHDGKWSSSTPLEPGAKKVLELSGKRIIMTDTSVFVGNPELPITASDMAVGGNLLYIASGSSLYSIDPDLPSTGKAPFDAGANITAVAAYGNTVYYAAGSTLLTLTDGVSVPLKLLDSNIESLTCLSATEVCYSTGAEIKIYNIATDEIVYSTAAFAADICAYGGIVYFLTSGGEVRKIAGKVCSDVITSASDADGFYNAPTNITSRKDTVLVVDGGNDRVSLIKSGAPAGSIKIYDPADAAIDYRGYIYVASSHSVKVFSSQLEPISVLQLNNGNIRDIVSIAVDYSEPVKNALYAVTADGGIAELTSLPQPAAAGGYKKVFVSVSGGLYALDGADDIVQLDKTDLSSPIKKILLSGANIVDFAVDAAENVYAAYSDSVVKYDRNGNTVNTSVISGEIGGIDISMVDMGEIAYGDILVTDKQKNRIVKCDAFTADMNEVEADEAYYAEVTGVGGRAVDSDSIIRTAVISNSDIYTKPIEMPARYSVSDGTKVIVIDKVSYDSSGYWFVLVDTPGGAGVYGFMNKNVLSSPYDYSAMPAERNCVILSDNTAIKKYPSVSAATVTVGNTGNSFNLLPFVDGYRDLYGNEWCRITYGEGYEGYILRGSVSIGGKVIIRDSDSMPKPNAKIKAVHDETFVYTYNDALGLELSDMTLGVGAEVEVTDTFNLSNDFTKIKYSYTVDGSTIIVRTCYVRTENIYYEETTIYQIIAFSVILVIVVLVVMLIIIKKRKENILADKKPKF